MGCDAGLQFDFCGRYFFKEQPIPSRLGVIERTFQAQADVYLEDHIRAYVNGTYRFDDHVSQAINDHFGLIKVGFDYEVRPGVEANLEYRYRMLNDGDDLIDYRSNAIQLSFKFKR